MRIRNRILFAFLPLVAIVLVVSLSATNWFITKQLRAQKEEQLESLAATQLHRLRYVIQHQVERFALVSSRTKMRKLIREYVKSSDPKAATGALKILNDAQSSLDEFNAIGIAGQDGRWITTTDPYYFPHQAGEAAWFDDALMEPDIYAFELDEEDIPSMIIAGPVELEGQLLGVLVIHASISSLVTATVDYTGLGETGETLLAMKDEHGNALFLTPTRFDPFASLQRTVHKTNLAAPMIQALLGNEGIIDNAIDYRDQRVVSVTRSFPNHPWGLVVKQDLEEVLLPLREIRNAGTLFALTIVPIAILMIFLISRGLSRPIAELTRKAQQIHASNIGSVAENSQLKGDEVSVLGSVIEDMTAALLKDKDQLEDRVQHRTRELEQKTAELSESENRFAFATEGSSDGLWDWPNVAEERMWFSDRVQELLGLAADTKLENIDHFGALVEPEKRAGVMHSLLKLANEGGVLQEEVRLQTAHGKYYWFALRCICRRDENTGFMRMAGSLQDIMATKEAEASLKKLFAERQNQATHDPLTNMLNRRGFEERWNVEVARVQRHEKPLFLMVVDADHFKSVNDKWGHQVGDNVLVMLAEAIRSCARKIDIAARFGGEEFVVALTEADQIHAMRIADRLRAYISEQECDNGEGGKISITCSIGMTAYSPDSELKEALDAADKALYQAKEEGRNRVVLAGN